MDPRPQGLQSVMQLNFNTSFIIFSDIAFPIPYHQTSITISFQLPIRPLIINHPIVLHHNRAIARRLPGSIRRHNLRRQTFITDTQIFQRNRLSVLWSPIKATRTRGLRRQRGQCLVNGAPSPLAKDVLPTRRLWIMVVVLIVGGATAGAVVERSALRSAHGPIAFSPWVRGVPIGNSAGEFAANSDDGGKNDGQTSIHDAQARLKKTRKR